MKCMENNVRLTLLLIKEYNDVLLKQMKIIMNGLSQSVTNRYKNVMKKTSNLMIH